MKKFIYRNGTVIVLMTMLVLFGWIFDGIHNAIGLFFFCAALAAFTNCFSDIYLLIRKYKNVTWKIWAVEVFLSLSLGYILFIFYEFILLEAALLLSISYSIIAIVSIWYRDKK